MVPDFKIFFVDDAVRLFGGVVQVVEIFFDGKVFGEIGVRFRDTEIWFSADSVQFFDEI